MKIMDNSIYALKQAKSGLKYSLHIIFHPFDGFYDLKHEKRGNIYTATFFVLTLILLFIVKRQFTGFVINTSRQKDLNILAEIVSVALPVLLWCASNWFLTTLTEGDGSFKDIYIYSCYSLVPLLLILPPLILYSRLLTIDGIAFYTFFETTGFVWVGILLFLGTLVTHQFTLGKTVFSVIVILIGMGVIVFIGLLFFNIVQQIIEFIKEIFIEYSLRV